jgi:hypothetical protein
MATVVAGVLMLMVSALALGQAPQHVKCEASVNGFKIHAVYIMGDQYNGVVWAYKHLAEETCLIPTTSLSNADAILEVHRIWTPGSQADTVPLSISCFSSGGTSTCRDSTGSALTVSCAGGSCTSYYGPDIYTAVSGAFDAWISTRWYESDAKLYTTDHKLLWRSEDQKGDWAGAGWIDKVRLGTNSPVCKVGAWSRSKYKSFRHWANMTCGVEFDPLVSIDLKLLDRQAAEKQKQDRNNEMLRNAHEAAAKQQQQSQEQR